MLESKGNFSCLFLAMKIFYAFSSFFMFALLHSSSHHSSFFHFLLYVFMFRFFNFGES